LEKPLLDFLNSCPERIKTNFIEDFVNQGEYIVHQEDEPEYVYFLIKGKVKVFRMEPNGINYLEYIYTDYEMFGEIEIINNRKILANVVADSNCNLLKLNKHSFFEWMKLDENFSHYVIHQISDKLYDACINSTVNIIYPLKYRVLYFLRRRLDISVSRIPKEEILESIGGRMRSFNRVLNELSDDKIIQQENGDIIICDREKLIEEMKKNE